MRQARGVTRLALIAACVVLAVPASAQDAASPDARTLHRSTAMGAEVRVFTYSQHHADCSPAAEVQIVMRSNPAHGTVSIRAASVVSGPSRFGAPDCSGKTMPGLAIWYTPSPGFRGADRFGYDVTFSNGVAHDTAAIEVK